MKPAKKAFELDRIAALEAALRAVTTADMDRAGGDAHGSSECPWCHAEGYGEHWHQPNCALVQARAVVAAGFLTAKCEGCGVEQAMPVTRVNKSNAPLPDGWAQSGTSRYPRLGKSPRLAAWCPRCRNTKPAEGT